MPQRVLVSVCCVVLWMLAGYGQNLGNEGLRESLREEGGGQSL